VISLVIREACDTVKLFGNTLKLQLPSILAKAVCGRANHLGTVTTLQMPPTHRGTCGWSVMGYPQPNPHPLPALASPAGQGWEGLDAVHRLYGSGWYRACVYCLRYSRSSRDNWALSIRCRALKVRGRINVHYNSRCTG